MSKMIFNGLEFVAGQEINNNGVFVDYNNLITSGTYIASTPLSYTATTDCYILIASINWGSQRTQIYIDGVQVNEFYTTSTNVQTVGYFLKKGQVCTATTQCSQENSYYTVYGLQCGSHNSVKYGTTDPTDSSYDGDTYIILDSNNKYKGLYLYMSNQWVLIDGIGATFEETIEWSNELFGGTYGHSHHILHVDTIQVVDAWYNWGNGWINSTTDINGYSGTYSADENKIYFSYSYFDASPNRRYRVKVRGTTD